MGAVPRRWPGRGGSGGGWASGQEGGRANQGHPVRHAWVVIGLQHSAEFFASDKDAAAFKGEIVQAVADGGGVQNLVHGGDVGFLGVVLGIDLNYAQGVAKDSQALSEFVARGQGFGLGLPLVGVAA